MLLQRKIDTTTSNNAPEQKEKVSGGFFQKVKSFFNTSIKDLVTKKPESEEQLLKKEEEKRAQEEKKAWNKTAVTTLFKSVKDNYEQFIGEKSDVPSFHKTIEELEQKKQEFFARKKVTTIPEQAVPATTTTTEETTLPETKKIPHLSLDILYSLTPDDLITSFVPEKDQADFFADYNYAVEHNTGKEKSSDLIAKELLIFSLIKEIKVNDKVVKDPLVKVSDEDMAALRSEMSGAAATVPVYAVTKKEEPIETPAEEQEDTFKFKAYFDTLSSEEKAKYHHDVEKIKQANEAEMSHETTFEARLDILAKKDSNVATQEKPTTTDYSEPTVEQNEAPVKTLGVQIEEENDKILQKLFQSEKLGSLKEARIFLQEYSKFIEADFLHKAFADVKTTHEENILHIENTFKNVDLRSPKTKADLDMIQNYHNMYEAILVPFEEKTMDLNSRIEMKKTVEAQLKGHIENIQELLTSEEETLSDEERLSSINIMVAQIEKVLVPMKSEKNPFPVKTQEERDKAMEDGTVQPQNFSQKNNS